MDHAYNKLTRSCTATGQQGQNQLDQGHYERHSIKEYPEMRSETVQEVRLPVLCDITFPCIPRKEARPQFKIYA